MPMDVCQGENFSQEPKEQENKKHKKRATDIVWTDTVATTSRKPKKKKKVSTHGDGLRGSWTGDMG